MGRELGTADGKLSDRDIRLAMYAPEDGGVNDRCIVRADDGWHYFHIYREYEKPEAATTPPQENKMGTLSQKIFSPGGLVPRSWKCARTRGRAGTSTPRMKFEMGHTGTWPTAASMTDLVQASRNNGSSGK
ncbi:MAG: hypothetical protein ABGZ35_21900 [Planctomycetaceae bacterium]